MMAKIRRRCKRSTSRSRRRFRGIVTPPNLNYDLTPMAKLRIQFENGDPEKVIEFDPAKAPFHHDGKPGSILDVMLVTASISSTPAAAIARARLAT